MNAQDLELSLKKYADEKDALFLQRFFKTGKGQYGEGDIFIGVRMPQLRLVCKQFSDLQLREVQKLLNSKVHEHRMAALIILRLQYRLSSEQKKDSIYNLYLKNVYRGRINNWDLVDASAPYIVGDHLMNRSRTILFELAKNNDIWQRRVAVLGSFAFINEGDSTTTIELAEQLLQDRHDLIQKAVGWSLREVGKRSDRAILIHFLDQHAHEMPRTMLRYSLEHLDAKQRAYYMSLKSSS